MKSKSFLEKIFVTFVLVATFFISIVFNPFISKSFYLDDNANYSFMGFGKILALIITNIVLSLLLIFINIKGKRVTFKLNYVLVLTVLVLVTTFFSTILSESVTSSFFGYNSILSNSYLEVINLAVFLFILVYGVKRWKEYEGIFKAFFGGVTLACLYSIIRFSIEYDSVSNFYLDQYLGALRFTPAGSLKALVFLASLGACFYLYVIHKSTLHKQRYFFWSQALDFFSFSLLLITLIVFFPLLNAFQAFVIIIPFLILISFIIYESYIKGERKALTSLIIIIVLNVFVGYLINRYLFIHDLGSIASAYRPNYEHDVKMLFDFFSESVKSMLIGEGQGSYTVVLDRFMDLSKVNDPKIYSLHSSSFLIELLISFGSVFFLFLLFSLLFIAYKINQLKETSKENEAIQIQTKTFLVMLSMFIGYLVFFSYSFLVNFLFCIFIASIVYKSYIQVTKYSEKDNDTSLSFSLQFIIVAVCLFIPLFSFLMSYKIIQANYYGYKAHESLIKENQNRYLNYIKKAHESYKALDHFGRVYVETSLDQSSNPLQDSSDNKDQINQEIKEDVSSQINYLTDLTKMYPLDYRNFYLLGIIKFYYAENYDQSYQEAIDIFEKTIVRKPNHAPSYYYLAQLGTRIEDYNYALNKINTAINIEYEVVDQILYSMVKGDILVTSGNENQALVIYNDIKQFVERSDNEDLRQYYDSLEIGTKINNLINKTNNETSYRQN